jgi:hypothetical protein
MKRLAPSAPHPRAGALAVAALQAYPHLRATVVDLPHVTLLAQQHFGQPRHVPDPRLLQRLQWLGADLFAQREALPAGDLYVLSRVVHDWEQPRVEQLLALVHGLLPPGGALLLCEMLLEPGRMGPAPALLQSLNMLVQVGVARRSLRCAPAELWCSCGAAACAHAAVRPLRGAAAAAALLLLLPCCCCCPAGAAAAAAAAAQISRLWLN